MEGFGTTPITKIEGDLYTTGTGSVYKVTEVK